MNPPIASSLELSDLIASYPPAPYSLDQQYPDYRFQAIVSNKKEFADLASGAREPPPQRGELYKHQELIKRYLRAYTDLFIISETGTGKTCAVAGFTEWASEQWVMGRPGGYKHVYVAVRGPAQSNEFKFQLTCRCSAPDKYITERVKKAIDESIQKRNLTNAVGEYYTILTYGALAKRIAALSDEQLIQEFSDTVIWIDEAQNLRIQQTSSRNPRRKKEIYDDVYRLFHVVPRIKRILSTATPMINDVSEIGPLINLFPSNSVPKIPPDFNYNAATLETMYPYFAGRVSYVRALDIGVVVREEGTLFEQDMPATEGLDAYRSQLTLRVSAMSDFQFAALRSAETQSRNSGALEVDSRFRSIYLGERQAANFVYPDGTWGTGVSETERARKREERRRRRGMGVPSVVVSGSESQLPVGTSGSVPSVGRLTVPQATTDEDIEEAEDLQEEAREPAAPGTEVTAFRKYVIMSGDTFTATPELMNALKGATPADTIKQIRRYSAKYADICELVSAPKAGNCFVYCDFVEGSGAIELCLCLEMLGYQRFNESSSIFLPEPGTSVRAFCTTSSGYRPIRSEFLPERGIRRYALLTQRTSSNSSRLGSILEAMNSYENRHGDIIQVIISSPIGQVGLNINNVLQTHEVGSHWNPGGEKQALGRTFRSNSHLFLLAEEEDRMRDEEEKRLILLGVPPEDARIQAQRLDVSGARIIMKVYKHAAVGFVTNEAEARRLGVPFNVPIETIDTKMYQLTELKAIKIQRMVRIMKQSAFDCRIHHSRNVRSTDVDGTPVCDYTVCNYSCVDDPQTLGQDTSTYDVYYSEPDITAASDLLVQYFGMNGSGDITQLRSLFPNVREKFLLMALSDLVTERRGIVDRYGYLSYLREDRGTFYLDRAYPTQTPQFALSTYSNSLIGLETTPLADVITETQANAQNQLLESLSNPALNPVSQEFVAILQRLNLESSAKLLESVVIRSIQLQRLQEWIQGSMGGQEAYQPSQREVDFNAVVIGFFQKNLFVMRRPDTQIEKAVAATQRTGRPGRVASAEGGPIKPLHASDFQNLEFDENTPIVYVHTVYTQVLNNSLYSYTSRTSKAEGRLRLLDTSIPLGWRDLNPLENREYNKMVQVQIMERKAPFERTGMYGFYGPKGEFLIRDIKNQSAQATTDNRKRNRGRNCRSWHRQRLVDVLWELHSNPLPSVIAVGRPETPEEFVIRTVPPPDIINVSDFTDDYLDDYLIRNIPKDPTVDWSRIKDPQVWTRQRKEFYYQYLLSSERKGSKIPLCDLIQRSMESQGRIQGTS